MRRSRSIQLRVLAVVLFAAVAAGAVAIRITTSMMTDLAEVRIVEDTVERTDRARAGLVDRLSVARAELTAAALLAEVERTAAVSSTLSPFVQAARLERDGEAIELVREPRARDVLFAAAGDSRALIDGFLVVRVDVGAATAIGVLDVTDLLPVGPSRSAAIELATDERLGIASVVVERRRTYDGEQAVALALVSDGLALRHEVSLGAARAEIAGEMLHVIGWGVVVTAALVLALAWMLSRRLTKPIRALAAAVRSGRGELVLPPLHADEIGELGRAIAAAHGALARDTRMLAVSARFARDALRSNDPQEITRLLHEALAGAHPEHGWRVHTGDARDEAIRRAGVPAVASWTRAGTEGVATPTIVEIDGWLVVRGDLGSSVDFVAVGRGTVGDDDRRSIETLCRTAVAALKNLELARAAAINDKLALIGKLSASVAHELNNPLAYVTLNLNLLEEELDGAQREIVRETLGGVQRVTRIVADMSRLTRSGRDDLAREDLVALVNDQVKVVRARTSSSPVELVVAGAGPCWVRCGRGRIGQAVLNLLANAIDACAGRPGAVVHVSFRREGGASARGVAIVRDNGPGIAGDVTQRLFDAFVTTKGDQGTGLGLYLSRQFVRDQGGELSLVSSGASGTTFEIALPLDGEQQPVSEPVAPVDAIVATEPASRSRVLVIDDEPVILRTLQRALSRYADVTTVSSGAEGIAAALAGPFELILCDWNMPGMTGGEVLDKLREVAPAAAERLVFMSGSPLSVGETPVLAKPVPLSRIRELIDAA